MADRTGQPRAGQRDRNGRAILVFAAAAVGLYLLVMVALTGLLEDAAGSLSYNRIWIIGVYWLIFIAPAVPALWGAALLTVAAVRPFNRPMLYYLATGLLMIGVVVFSLYIVAGTRHGLLLATLVLVTGVAAWFAVRRVLAQRAD